MLTCWVPVAAWAGDHDKTGEVWLPWRKREQSGGQDPRRLSLLQWMWHLSILVSPCTPSQREVHTVSLPLPCTTTHGDLGGLACTSFFWDIHTLRVPVRRCSPHLQAGTSCSPWKTRYCPCVICLQSPACKHHGKVTSPFFWPSFPWKQKWGEQHRAFSVNKRKTLKEKRGKKPPRILFLLAESLCLSCPHSGTYLSPTLTTWSRESRPCHSPSLIAPVNVHYPAD